MIEETEKRHQAVRELVEAKYPHCRVTEIREEAKTTYALKRRKDGALLSDLAARVQDEWVLGRIEVSFRVETQPIARGPWVECKVQVDERGGLYLDERDTMIIDYYP